MLQLLTVRSLALVDSVQLELGPGLTVLTGETGAGKSVLLSALSLVLGGRASTDSVRAGAEEAEVEALFEVSAGSRLDRQLSEAGIAHEGELLIRRSIQGQRSRAFVNGRLATLGMLQDILRGVVELTGQHENVGLLDPEAHLELLDRWAGADAVRRRVADGHGEVEAYRRLLASMDEDDAHRAQRQDFLRFALEEMKALDPQPGETEALQQERERLRRSEELQTTLAEAHFVLAGGDGGEGSVCELLGRAQSRLERLQDLDPEGTEIAEDAVRLGAEVEELARRVHGWWRRVEADPARLNEVEDRLASLKRLQRKYGGSESGVQTARARMEEELDQIEHNDVRRTDLEAALQNERRRLEEAAQELSRMRRQAAPSLAAAVKQHLAGLHMGECGLEFRMEPHGEPGARGAESVELMFSPHPSEPLRPLRKVASGGELSRLLLALKREKHADARVMLQAFDEVDAGLGGGAADALGAMLRAVAQGAQVLCITHLPQVAARADAHLRVVKTERAGRAVTEVHPLSGEERVEELARMLGAKVTPKSRSLARELLERASDAPATDPRSAAPRRRRTRKATESTSSTG